MNKDEALKLALSALNEVRQETFRLMRDGQTLYAEKKVWEAIYTIKKVLAQPERDYERGFIDGMQKQMQSSVDKAVNAMTQRKWVGLTDEEIETLIHRFDGDPHTLLDEVNARLKEKNI